MRLIKAEKLVAALALFAFVPRPAAAELEYFWDCTKSPWTAYTTYRSMEGWTAFECGGGCGDTGHSQPYSWVDITGGISQSQEDHSDSFYGPVSGEWDGCALQGSHQESTGVRNIVGLDESWDRWPLGFRSVRIDQNDISFLNGSSWPMRTPFASVYDLDCAPWIGWIWGGSCPKDIIGTIYWGDFPVTARLLSGNPVAHEFQAFGGANWILEGDALVACSAPENGCQSVVCADLHVRANFQCTRKAIDPIQEMCRNMDPRLIPPPECEAPQ
jgi:hypothetical protein